jgi:hypothetical protein
MLPDALAQPGMNLSKYRAVGTCQAINHIEVIDLGFDKLLDQGFSGSPSFNKFIHLPVELGSFAAPRVTRMGAAVAARKNWGL